MQARNDWTRQEIQALYEQPFLDLVFQAQQVHRQHFEANSIPTCMSFGTKPASTAARDAP